MNRTERLTRRTRTALLALSGAAASPVKITAQSIVVNPVETGLNVDVWVNRDASGQASPVCRSSEKLALAVKTNADLFNVNANGTIALFFSNAWKESNFVQAGVTRVFPAQGTRYSFTVDGPSGQDKLLALASSKQLTLDDIARLAADQRLAQGRRKDRGNLARALSIVVGPLPADGWTTDLALCVSAGPVKVTPQGAATGTVTTTPGQAAPERRSPRPLPRSSPARRGTAAQTRPWSPPTRA